MKCQPLSAYELTAQELSTEALDMNQLFDWLRGCLAMLDAGSKLYGDLSAVVAARTLARLNFALFVVLCLDGPKRKLFTPRIFLPFLRTLQRTSSKLPSRVKAWSWLGVKGFAFVSRNYHFFLYTLPAPSVLSSNNLCYFVRL